ncbi:MAG: hypothetical protein ACOC1G_00175, partial [Phycisphaeraceae bacterium]
EARAKVKELALSNDGLRSAADENESALAEARRTIDELREAVERTQAELAESNARSASLEDARARLDELTRANEALTKQCDDAERRAAASEASSSDAEAATQTTLFQCYLPDAPAMPIEVDGEAHATLPWQIRQSESVTRILDPYRNGFVVPAGQPLHIARQPQTSRDANNIRDTAGDYAVAWIDHGPAPSDQNYEYAMLVQTTPQQLADFADDPPYRVLQRDEHAHIVQHTRHDAIGYAIFTAEREITHGPLARTDTPVTAFAKPMPDGGLLFRVADPDLRLPRKGNLGFLTPEDEQQLREPHRVRLLLHGRWLTDAQTPAALHKYNDDQTLLEWEAADGLPLELELRPWAESLG